ncbi:hypothetical protein V6N12_060000 [Hibiscus sabdariffa]|uniref:Uncharacterized protein n=1 Tax=Hibiscus sabdariffa TaxID=183260 RepID=A0ABR2D368_9ROSI
MWATAWLWRWEQIGEATSVDNRRRLACRRVASPNRPDDWEQRDARCFSDLLPPPQPSIRPYGREARRPAPDLVTVDWLLIGVLKS